MLAKKTIAKNSVIGIYDENLTPREKELVEWAKKGQSEISFEAGYKKGIEDANKGIKMIKILCWLGFHKWTKWSFHPLYGGLDTRQCRRCYKRQDKRVV